MKILIMGLPGSGKTSLATAISAELCAVHFNADAVRTTINSHLGFSEADRMQQAATMRFLCDCVDRSGHIAIADFVCPTHSTRDMFDSDTTIWMNTIAAGRFADTNAIFEVPKCADLVITDLETSVQRALAYIDVLRSI